MSEVLAGLQLYPRMSHITQPTHTQSHLQVYVNIISLVSVQRSNTFTAQCSPDRASHVFVFASSCLQLS